jgi:hypothetical protein
MNTYTLGLRGIGLDEDSHSNDDDDDDDDDDDKPRRQNHIQNERH